MNGVHLELLLKLIFAAAVTLIVNAVMLRYIFKASFAKALAVSSSILSITMIVFVLAMKVQLVRSALANSNDELLSDLKSAIERWRNRPAAIPFPTAVEAVSGHSVIPFDRRSKSDQLLLKRLSNAIAKAAKSAYREGVRVHRVNEFGNRMESYVRESLRESGFYADIPVTKSGARHSSGYPDVCVKDSDGRVIYIECKTYNPKTLGSSYRTFYFSPPRSLGESKITTDAHHLIVSFQTKHIIREDGPVYVPVRWRIYTTDSMSVHLKYEFNASNRMIYQKDALLAEGGV